MALVNVNRSNPDVFYRYKMPKLIAKVEGKGNGIKTVICNMPEIGKSLMRPATYPTKYFGCELGAQTQFDVKHDRYIVNGAHEAEKLQELLDGFIRRFVLCPECENPETVLSVHVRAQNISQKCQACGYAGKLDMRHKLTTYILKNPPTDISEGGMATKPSKKSAGGDDEESPDESAADGNNSVPVGAIIEENRYEDEDEIDWGEDTSEEAQKQRMLELTSAVSNLAVNADMEKTPQERADLFFQFIKNKMAESGDSGTLDSCHYKAIVDEAKRLEIKDKGPLILAELLLSAEILRDLKQHAPLFQAFMFENEKAQRYMLGAIEKLVGVEFHDTLINKTANVLKALYDLDLVEEDAFLEWSKKVSKKYVSKEVGTEIHAKAEPFITWLKEAEEEETSSEEDGEPEEDEVEVAFTHSEKVGMHEVSSTAGPAVNGTATANGASKDDDEDEIDLDDI